MPHFVLIATDGEGVSEKRKAARPEHVARLKQLNEEGRLIVAGPCPLEDTPEVMSGSIIIAEFDSMKEARSWAALDPYVAAGVYTDVVIKPFIKALP